MGMVDLRDLGWDDSWGAALSRCPGPGTTPGRVALEDRQAFAVVTEDGECPARVAGRLLQGRLTPDQLPKVGDWVAVTRRPGDTRAVIQEVLPRRTWLARKAAGRETTPQILATNIDVVFVVQSLDATFNPRRIERFLVMAHEGGARAVVLLNKADLAAPDDPRITEAKGRSKKRRTGSSAKWVSAVKKWAMRSPWGRAGWRRYGNLHRGRCHAKMRS